MKKYGILLSPDEHRSLKRLAADEDSTMQDIARDAVLAAINKSDRRDLSATGPPADAAKLRRAAATARNLATQLESIAGGNDSPQSNTISMPIEALISLLMEMMTNGQNTPAADAVQAAVDRISREFGTPDSTTEADSGGATATARRKRGTAG